MSRVKTPSPAEPPAIVEMEKVITGESIREKLSAVGELVTAEYAATELGGYESAKAAELFGQGVSVPRTRTRFLYSYDGVTRAGIDCSAITVEKDDGLMRIRVVLPKAKLFRTELAADSFRYYDERTGTFTPIAIPDLTAVDPVLAQTVEQHAVEGGLLSKADEQACSLVSALLEGMFASDGF
ncbi:MAG: DUF4230 domain-containing protein, partial [Oscillospiraceae bacterium]|nr:DUF4230 domain-containing protein [Oscillospiraceae bacterium]